METIKNRIAAGERELSLITDRELGSRHRGGWAAKPSSARRGIFLRARGCRPAYFQGTGCCSCQPLAFKQHYLSVSEGLSPPNCTKNNPGSGGAAHPEKALTAKNLSTTAAAAAARAAGFVVGRAFHSQSCRGPHKSTRAFSRKPPPPTDRTVKPSLDSIPQPATRRPPIATFISGNRSRLLFPFITFSF